MRATHDGRLVGRGHATRHGPLHRVKQIVMHRAAPLQVAGRDELLAEARRSPVIHRQHSVAALLGSSQLLKGSMPHACVEFKENKLSNYGKDTHVIADVSEIPMALPWLE